ncbi:MAG TPA: hypothetical protein VEW92_06630 [Nitrososphaeraceae archaeon]|nr:hypothetical protein [Nitrososphaeraceae archaeon]
MLASIATCNDSDIDIIGAYRLSRYTNRICIHLEPSKSQSCQFNEEQSLSDIFVGKIE